ncbi:MAG: hypothetical protein QNJ63_17110 [Calothrix sp. MO_192.B10]|nr:hypothetical protein [Calothrix sp. MO_192.B10]
MADTHAHSYAPECPKCGHYSMVEQGDDKWTCLNCGFSKELPSSEKKTSESKTETSETETKSGSNTIMAILLLIILIIAVVAG